MHGHTLRAPLTEFRREFNTVSNTSAHNTDHFGFQQELLTANAERRFCPLCGRDNSEQSALRYSKNPWKLKKCTQCALVYLENTPGYDALKVECAWEKTYQEEKLRRRQGRALRYLVSDAGKKAKKWVRGGGQRAKEQRFIRRYIKQGRMLDVGCGTGKTLLDLPDTVVPYGIEISPVLANRSRQYCELRGGFVVNDNALNALESMESDFFDGIIMRAFLEHEIKPLQLLETVRRTLKPGGRVIIKVPNFACVNRLLTGRRWCGFRFPDHVNYFTPSSLRRLALQTGYRVLHFGIFNRFPLSDNMWMVTERQ